MDDEDIDQQKLFILFHIERNESFKKYSDITIFTSNIYKKMGIDFDIPEKTAVNKKAFDRLMNGQKMPSWTEGNPVYAELFSRVVDVYCLQHAQLYARFLAATDTKEAFEKFTNYIPPIDIQNEIDQVLVSYFQRQKNRLAESSPTGERSLRKHRPAAIKEEDVIPVKKPAKRALPREFPKENGTQKILEKRTSNSQNVPEKIASPVEKQEPCVCSRGYSVAVLHDQIQEMSQTMKRIEEQQSEIIRLFKTSGRKE